MTHRSHTSTCGTAVPPCADARLYELLGVGARDAVSFTGGGGKTSLMFHLCRELACDGHHVLVTTTTKMYYPHGFDGEIVVDGDIERVASALRTCPARAAFAAAGTCAGGKVAGYDPVTLDALFELLPSRIMLYEADGAARKPYKFYREDEPVLGRCSLLVHVIGCDVLDERMDASLLHRCPPDRVGERFDEDAFERAMRWYACEKTAGRACRKVLVVNKADEGREAAAERMHDIGARYFDACLVTSLREGRWHA